VNEYVPFFALKILFQFT